MAFNVACTAKKYIFSSVFLSWYFGGSNIWTSLIKIHLLEMLNEYMKSETLLNCTKLSEFMIKTRTIMCQWGLFLSPLTDFCSCFIHKLHFKSISQKHVILLLDLNSFFKACPTKQDNRTEEEHLFCSVNRSYSKSNFHILGLEQRYLSHMLFLVKCFKSKRVLLEVSNCC